MFYKGHVIRDTSQNSGKIKGQGLVCSGKNKGQLQKWTVRRLLILSTNLQSLKANCECCLHFSFSFRESSISVEMFKFSIFFWLAYKGQDYGN